MADEQITENVENTEATENNEVVLSQSKLDSLIDKGFSKGVKRAKSELAEQLGVDSLEQARELIQAKMDADEASKSDLEKASETIQALNKTIESLESTNKNLQYDMEIQKVVSKNGINDSDYFKHLMATASKSEDFELDTFINSLKGEKPYLFNDGVSAKPKVDATSNKAQLDVNARISGAKSMAELYKLQQELT